MEPFCYYRVLKFIVSINEFENISCFYLKTHFSDIFLFLSLSADTSCCFKILTLAFNPKKQLEICFNMKLSGLRCFPHEAF